MGGVGVARFQIDPAKTAVLVVDMQNEFVEPEGIFPVPGAPGLADRIGLFLAEARDRAIPVIFTAYAARQELPPTPVAIELFGPKSLKSAHLGRGAEIYHKLRPQSGEILVEKRRQSAFYGTDLEVVLRTLGVDTLIICGLTTNVCCLATARDAAARDFRVVFLSDLTATFDLPGIDGGVVPGEVVQAVTCAIVAHSIGEVTTVADLLNRLPQPASRE